LADQSDIIDKKSLISQLNKINQDYVREDRRISLKVNIPDVGEITCSKVFRAIQGKRLVCLGEIRSRIVIVKLYFSARRAHANWKRSSRGCRAFAEKGIPSPEIIFSGHIPEYGLYALVFEYLIDAMRIDSALEACHDVKGREVVLDQLMGFIALCHERGLEQNDLHLGNFMIQDECIYALDGDQVKAYARPMSRRQSFKNLAGLLANIPPTFITDFNERVMVYGSMRQWVISDAEVAAIMKEVSHIRWDILAEYLRKIYKSKDPFIAISKDRFFSVYDHHNFDIRFDDIISTATQMPFSGNRLVNDVPVGVLTMQIWSSIGYGPVMFRRFWPAGRVWRNALMLRRIGICTPVPVALTGIYKKYSKWECAVFFKSAVGMTLRDFFISDTITINDKENIACCLADACSRMTDMGIWMERLTPEEVLVSENNVVFLSLDAVRISLSRVRNCSSSMLHGFISLWENEPDIRCMLKAQFKQRGLIEG
jgi:hypothetical protein